MRHTLLLLGTLALFVACTSPAPRDEGCSDSCPYEGATHCDGETLRTCVVRPDDCLGWSTGRSCPDGQFCNAETEQCERGACQNSCQLDAIRCGADGLVQRCEMDENECPVWTEAE